MVKQYFVKRAGEANPPSAPVNRRPSGKTVGETIYGSSSRALRDALAALETERGAIEAELLQAAPSAVEIRHGANDVYRRKIGRLKPPSRPPTTTTAWPLSLISAAW